MSSRRTFPSLPQLRAMPAGERAPRLRALIEFHRARLDDPNPHVQASYRAGIAKVRKFARLAGISDLGEQ
jgi:hypothetical protein